jgi:hypothetical protein
MPLEIEPVTLDSSIGSLIAAKLLQQLIVIAWIRPTPATATHCGRSRDDGRAPVILTPIVIAF